MRADLALRACMLGLVLVDLVFVQLTGATGLHWLAPLVVLTLLSPWTGSLRDKRHVLTFRRPHAHAWVEVFDPGVGWYAVDATPATLQAGGPSMWARIETSLGAAWARLAGFNAQGRSAVFAWMRSLPGRAWQGLRSHPGLALIAALGAMISIAVLVGRRRRGDASVRRYHRALRRCSLELQPGETPRDLLERARERGLAREQLELLRASTHSHELSRYAA